MTDELFQTERKIKARSPLNAYQQGIYTIIWVVMWLATVFADLHPHHHPIGTMRKIVDFVGWPILCIANLFFYLKLRFKEQAE